MKITFKKIWTTLLLMICIIQIILARIAEYDENYLKAMYEMLWLFFFMFLLHKEESS